MYMYIEVRFILIKHTFKSFKQKSLKSMVILLEL